MVDKPSIASGSELWMFDAADANPVLLAEVTKIGDLVFDAPLVDATRLIARAKEYVAGLPDTPGLDIEFRFLGDDPTQNAATGVAYVFAQGQERKYQVKPFNQSVGYEFRAVPTGSGLAGLNPGDLMKRPFKIKLSGPMTEVDASTIGT